MAHALSVEVIVAHPWQVGWQGSDPNPGFGGAPSQQQAQQAAAQRAEQEQRMASALQSGQFGNMSLDELMMRSMSDPGYFQPREGGVLPPVRTPRSYHRY